MLNIVIPMAGLGSRFANEGYKDPKPLIPVHGIPMIKVVVDNLSPRREHRFIFICQKAHIEKYGLVEKLKSYAKNVEVVVIDKMTEGQVCTALLAKSFFDNDDPLMCANADQFIDFKVDHYLEYIEKNNYDGAIITMKSDDPKWSYAKIDNRGLVTETAEKKVISEHATVGVFNFSKGKYLVKSAEQMISENIRVNGEFYTCPCYNYLIKEKKKIGIYDVGEEYNGMHGLGIPKDLNLFLENPISRGLKC